MTDLTFRKAGVALIASLFFVLALDLSVYSGKMWTVAIIVALLLGIAVVRLKYAIFTFIFIYVFSDLYSIETLYDFSGMSSIHSVYIGVYSLAIWLGFFFLLMQLAARGFKVFIDRNDSVLLLLSLLAASGVVFGIPNVLAYPREFMGGAAPYIAIFLGYFLSNVACEKAKDTEFLFNVLLYGFVSKSAIILFKFLTGKGSTSAYLLVPIFDPIGGFYTFLFSLAITLILITTKRQLLAGVFLLFLSLILMIFNSGRSPILFAMLSIAVIPFILPKRLRNYSRLLLLLSLTMFPIMVMAVASPVFFYYVLWRLGNLAFYGGMSDMGVRTAEILNILYTHLDMGTLFTGLGFGGYISDSYVPFSNGTTLLNSAFSYKALSSGQFFSMHEQFIDVFLQNGIIGLFLIVMICLLITKRVARFANSLAPPLRVKIKVISLLIPLIFLFLIGFSAKSFFLFGVLFSIMSHLISAYLPSDYKYRRFAAKQM